MASVSENLERYYGTFIERSKPLEFFTGLGDYVSYIVKTPTLKSITDRVMEMKYEEYEELNKLEEKSLEELQKAKKILLKIIKDNNLPPNSFKPHWPAVPGYSENLLDELRRFEEGEIHSGHFKSDTLEGYLFEVAAGITEQGHPELVKQFSVPGEEYRRYRPGIMGNIRGNFIFSKTLQKRSEKTQIIEKQKGFEMWPCFDALFKFHKAFGEISKNLTFAEAVNLMGKESRNHLENNDVVNIIFALEDLRKMSDDKPGYNSNNSRIHYLEIEKFKWFATRVHSHLLAKLSEKEPIQSKSSGEYELNLSPTGDLWREPKNKHCYAMMEAKERLNIVRLLATNQTDTYLVTQNLATGLGKNAQYIRSEIGKINRITKVRLGLKLIESKQGSGYRLYPNIKIKILPR